MSNTQTLFSTDQIEKIIQTHPTPFHLYDEKQIRENARAFTAAFAWNAGFKEYFAVKATPNPAILKILADEGLGVDCSSMTELLLAERIGLRGDEIMFSSNVTPAAEYQKAAELGAIINLDAVEHIPFLEEHVGLPELVCLRYNPGSLKEGNLIIGHPVESKFGMTREQLFAGFQLLQDKGVKRFGLHTMVASNELDAGYFVETAVLLFQLIRDLTQQLGIQFEFVNLGGGIGIPYRPEQQPINMAQLGKQIQQAYENIIIANGIPALKLYIECGRVITGTAGLLVSRVRHIKETTKRFAGLDACMANLMRPGLYGAYHHISILGKEQTSPETLYDVTGSLCENNDKFAVDRLLPQLEVGDLLLIHDTGAHGHAMGFNYNGKLRSAELLLRENGQVDLIRRAETVEDYFATLVD